MLCKGHSRKAICVIVFVFLKTNKGHGDQLKFSLYFGRAVLKIYLKILLKTFDFLRTHCLKKKNVAGGGKSPEYPWKMVHSRGKIMPGSQKKFAPK